MKISNSVYIFHFFVIQVEVSCILGGIQRCERLFPHLITHKNNNENEDFEQCATRAIWPLFGSVFVRYILICNVHTSSRPIEMMCAHMVPVVFSLARLLSVRLLCIVWQACSDCYINIGKWRM